MADMAVSNKTQMVLGHNSNIIVSNDQQPPVTSARQLLMKFIHRLLSLFFIFSIEFTHCCYVP